MQYARELSLKFNKIQKYTYRVYDYNRGRELHVDKALDVVD